MPASPIFGQTPANSESAPTPASKIGTNEADIAWRDLEKVIKAPPAPAGWETNQPSEAELAKWSARNGELAAKAADQAKEFYTRFPSHPKATEARKAEFELVSTAVQLGNTNRAAQLAKMQEDRVRDPALSEEERASLRFQEVQRKITAASSKGITAQLDEFEQGGWALQKDFPRRSDIVNQLLQLAQVSLQYGEMERAERTLRRLSSNTNFPQLAEITKPMLRQFDFTNKPLKLKFKAADEKEIDLTQLHGKVVLLDFWASWCGPCMMQVPHIRSVYEKYHPKGLEIVGISLDTDRTRFEQTVEQSKLTWPHYFDGKGWGNSIATDLGISGSVGIPAMWLIDKKGVVRDQKALLNLEAQVEKLLAEKD